VRGGLQHTDPFSGPVLCGQRTAGQTETLGFAGGPHCLCCRLRVRVSKMGRSSSDDNPLYRVKL
jgi:hypothetical protein